jgi:hypothetical protein
MTRKRAGRQLACDRFSAVYVGKLAAFTALRSGLNAASLEACMGRRTIALELRDARDLSTYRVELGQRLIQICHTCNQYFALQSTRYHNR